MQNGIVARATRMGCELAPKEAPPGKELATFAGGCFWGLELKFMREPGVEKTSSGYTQGETEKPTYEEVCSGRTGHTEAVQVQPPASGAEMRCYLGVTQAFHDANLES
jgi:methionine-S-sulfoxide reductase